MMICCTARRARIFSLKCIKKSPPSLSSAVQGSNHLKLIKFNQVRHNASFAEELTLGKLKLNWMFPYPSLNSKEDFDEITMLCETIRKYFDQHVDSAKHDFNMKIDDQVMKDLKLMGLFGLQVPAEYEGLGLNNLQYLYVVQELARDGSIYSILHHHNMAIKAIVAHGSEDQKKRFLPRLATGELIASFCFGESLDGIDADQISTFAYLNDEKTHWILNGEKPWVINGTFAQIFVVFAKTKLVDVKGKTVEKITAFLVEKSNDGVWARIADDQIGLRSSGSCSVVFDDTPVPVDCVLGDAGMGYKSAINVINSARLACGSYSSGLLKQLTSSACHHSFQRQQFGTNLADFPLIQHKITDMTSEAYAMESAAFIIASQSDEAATAIESAVLKIHSSESVWRQASECLQVFGGLGYMNEYPYQQVLRDVSFQLNSHGPNHILKQFVALSCLKFAAKDLQSAAKHMYKVGSRERNLLTKYHDPDGVHMNREPWLRTNHNPARRRRNIQDSTLEFLHPDLHDCGRILHHCVDVYYTRLLCLMRRKAKRLPQDELMLENMSDITGKIFMMSCVISRCNKSLLFNMDNSHNEVNLASYFVNTKFRELSIIFDQIHDEFTEGYASEQRRISEKIFNEREYIFTHPLEVLHRYKEHPKYLEALSNMQSLPS